MLTLYDNPFAETIPTLEKIDKDVFGTRPRYTDDELLHLRNLFRSHYKVLYAGFNQLSIRYMFFMDILYIDTIDLGQKYPLFAKADNSYDCINNAIVGCRKKGKEVRLYLERYFSSEESIRAYAKKKSAPGFFAFDRSAAMCRSLKFCLCSKSRSAPYDRSCLFSDSTVLNKGDLITAQEERIPLFGT